MDRSEYMCIPANLIPHEMIEQYNLQNKIKNRKVSTKIVKGMYGLPRAGILANHKLKKDLLPYGYIPCRHTPGLWRHIWRLVTFTLVVDDFEIKYEGREHADHLINSLKKLYEKITVD